jgi:hypothetical protein
MIVSAQYGHCLVSGNCGGITKTRQAHGRYRLQRLANDPALAINQKQPEKLLQRNTPLCPLTAATDLAVALSPVTYDSPNDSAFEPIEIRNG